MSEPMALPGLPDGVDMLDLLHSCCCEDDAGGGGGGGGRGWWSEGVAEGGGGGPGVWGKLKVRIGGSLN